MIYGFLWYPGLSNLPPVFPETKLRCTADKMQARDDHRWIRSALGFFLCVLGLVTVIFVSVQSAFDFFSDD